MDKLNTGESKYESTCVYYYLFLFSAWWFTDYCGNVALNGKYNPTQLHGFLWYGRATGYIVPNRSEMKIRRK